MARRKKQNNLLLWALAAGAVYWLFFRQPAPARATAPAAAPAGVTPKFSQATIDYYKNFFG